MFKDKLGSITRALDGIDPFEKAETLGLQKRDQGLVFDFFNRQIYLDSLEFQDVSDDRITDALKLVFYTYLLKSPDRVVKSSNRLVSFREFENAGPLFSRFTANTAKIIETTFSGKLPALRQKCSDIGCSAIETAGYDFSVRFRALPRIPVILHFNDAGDGMPAAAVFLFHDNAEVFLDLECMTILTTYLTGQLIQSF